jgi:hypothetical protein
MHPRPFRIGLLVDSMDVSKYVCDLAKWAQAEGSSVVITHIFFLAPGRVSFLERIQSSVTSNATGRRSANLLSKALFALVNFLESRLLRKHKRHKDHLARIDISSLVSGTIMTVPVVSTVGGYRFNVEDINRIKNLNLDLLLSYSRTLGGDILNVARFGIISLHHDTTDRDVPAGFWEVYRQQETTGFTIQRLTDGTDDRSVLMRGRFQTQPYFLLNQANLLERSNYYLKTLLTRISETDALPQLFPSAAHFTGSYRRPTACECGYYLGSLVKRKIEKAFKKLIRKQHVWNVAYTFTDWQSAVSCSASKLDAESSCYLADPFVISKDGKNICFLEEFDCTQNRGRIVAYALDRDRSRRLGVAISEPFHLSFPFIFEYRGETYMCPESSEARDIRIYKCLEFPLRWSLCKIVMKNISAADTMFLEKDEKWWMFTNIDPIEAGDHTAELAIFYADMPLGESWVPHRLNPVIVDSARARNAGLLTDGKSHFRVAQQQGFGVYGKCTTINEIVKLTETQYEEKVTSVITPEFVKGAVGTHHLHSNGRTTVFDFATWSFV